MTLLKHIMNFFHNKIAELLAVNKKELFKQIKIWSPIVSLSVQQYYDCQ